MDTELLIFNINDKAIVRLTEAGVNVLKEHLLIFTPPSHISKTFLDYQTNFDYEFHIWELMNIFGPKCFVGSKQIFIDNEIKIKRDVE